MKILRNLLCYILVLTFFTVSAFAFPDVTENYDWAKNAITSLSDQGYLNGYPDGTFAPGQSITRAEFAKLITVMFGNNAAISYEDVSEGDWFYPYVSQSGGYFIAENNFFPQKNITRQEVAYAIFEALNLTDSPLDKSVSFRDLETVDKADLPAVKTLAREGLINGYPDGSFGPGKEITRAEIATVLERALNYQPTEKEEPETSKESTQPLTYFFVVTHVSTVLDENNEPATRVEGYQNGKLTTLTIGEDVTIEQSQLADDTVIEHGDILSYFSDINGKIRYVSIGMNVHSFPRYNPCIEIVQVGDTIRRHIAAGTVTEIYKQKEITLSTFVLSTEKTYQINDPVHVYELTAGGKIILSDLSEITDSRYETGDTVIAFSYDDVLREILIVRE